MSEDLIDLLKKLDIDFKYFEHEPVLDYEKAEEIRRRFKLEGVESKSLFIKSKSSNYYIFITIEKNKLSSNKVKKLIGEKVSIASIQELKQITGSTPGCVSPFGYSQNISVIVDKEIFNYDKFVFSPGKSEITIEMKTKDINKILEAYGNKKRYY